MRIRVHSMPQPILVGKLCKTVTFVLTLEHLFLGGKQLQRSRETQLVLVLQTWVKFLASRTKVPDRYTPFTFLCEDRKSYTQ